MPGGQRRSQLKNISILVADGDARMADVLTDNLRIMGFANFLIVESGEAVINTLKEKPYDVLVTEWPMQPMDGIELLRYLRRDPQSPARTIPVIMLTGKGERADVETARDAGATEFVVKPYDSKTLYSRVEQIVENPRGIIFSDNFVGPDRRRREVPWKTADERRNVKPLFIRPEDAASRKQGDPPRIIHADHALKRKTGIPDPLNTIITPDIVNEAQKAIDDLRDASLLWIKEDLMSLDITYQNLTKNFSPKLLDRLKEITLSIKSRAGMFGYPIATEIARLLYLFLCADYNPSRPKHNLVITKHIELLKVVLAGKVGDMDEAVRSTLVKELQAMIQKHKK